VCVCVCVRLCVCVCVCVSVSLCARLLRGGVRSHNFHPAFGQCHVFSSSSRYNVLLITLRYLLAISYYLLLISYYSRAVAVKLLHLRVFCKCLNLLMDELKICFVKLLI